MSSENRPTARRTDLVERELDGELLIYDMLTAKAHCLNQTSALVYRLCDGNRSVSDIKESISRELKSPVPEDVIWLALDQLRRENLLADSNKIAGGLKGLTRREVIKKIGLASVIALPLITSIVAPQAATAASCIPTGGACSLANPGACCSSTCVNHGGGVITCA